jgi:hypothetical protein
MIVTPAEASIHHARGLAASIARGITQAVILVIAVVLVVCAIGANQRWLDRHFLPSFLFSHAIYVQLESAARVAMAIVGAMLVRLAPRAGRWAADSPAQACRIAAAIVLAIAVSEPALRRAHLGPAEWLRPDEEPRRRPDARLGWTFVPARTGHATIGGRVVDYAIDAAGYRVRRVDEAVDFERPAILFVGESVMFGEGLTWEESVPAQVEAMTGTQSANLAVHGFGNDQAYLRLQMELPRFHRPVAVVSLFMTELFGRNLDTERPHLGAGLVWLPADQRSRLETLARLIVPYHGDAVIERGITTTSEILRATAELARARGATPLIVVPQFGDTDEARQALRRRILDDARLPYVSIEIDPAWRLPWDRHPDARAARAVAAVIAARLQAAQ